LTTRLCILNTLKVWNQPAVYVGDVLQIIYPDIDPTLLCPFAEIKDTTHKTLNQIVKERLQVVQWLATQDGQPKPHVAMYYLQLFLDSHIDAYKTRKAYKYIANCPTQFYPENVRLYCQTTMPMFGIDSIIPEEGVIKPMEKLIQTVVASVDKPTTSTRALSSAMKDTTVRDFVHACMHVSTIGNYIHVEQRTYDIRERIKLLDSATAIHSKQVAPKLAEAAILEYLAAMIPMRCPVTSKTTIPWKTLTEYARTVANAVFRAAGPMPPKLINVDKDERISFAEVTQIDAATGNRSLHVCMKCSGMASYIKNRPHGMKPLKTYTDPFADIPEIICIACDTPTTQIHVQNCYIAIARFTSLMACPVCNHVHCVKGPITSTLCSECIITSPEDTKKAAAIVYTAPEHESTLVAPHRTCYKLGHPIRGTAPAYLQLVWDPKTRKLLRLATCYAHRSIAIIVTSAYTTTQPDTTQHGL